MAIRLKKDVEKRLVSSIKRYLAENLGEEIGDLKAMLFLDYCLEEIGPCVYNQAISDAQAHMQERVEDLNSSCFHPEFGFWKKSDKEMEKKMVKDNGGKRERTVGPGAPPNEPARIADEAARAFDGDPWHGPSLMRILDGASASDAAARPIAGAHSIWEIILHVTAWIREVDRRLKGGAPRELGEGDWPKVGDSGDGAWREACASLARAHEDLLSTLRRTPEERLWEILGGPERDPAQGTGVSFYVVLHGLVQHNVYHGAQITMLRKALRKI